jgi:hypothetical protein
MENMRWKIKKSVVLHYRVAEKKKPIAWRVTARRGGTDLIAFEPSFF